MIKEKNCKFDKSGSGFTPECTWLESSDELTLDYFENALKENFVNMNIPVTITQDEFEYKTGFMKKGHKPCLVVAGESDNRMSRFVLLVEQLEDKNATYALSYWCGDSESDILNREIESAINRYNRGLNKQDRKMNESVRLNDVMGVVGNKVTSSITNKLRDNKINKLIQKRDECIEMEDKFLKDVLCVVKMTFDKISEKYERLK